MKAPATTPVPCKSCGRAMLWTEWPASGRRMPVDAEPDLVGDLVLALSADKLTLKVEKFDAAAHEGRRRFTSHFATCPQAKEHRRSR